MVLSRRRRRAGQRRFPLSSPTGTFPPKASPFRAKHLKSETARLGSPAYFAFDTRLCFDTSIVRLLHGIVGETSPVVCVSANRRKRSSRSAPHRRTLCRANRNELDCEHNQQQGNPGRRGAGHGNLRLRSPKALQSKGDQYLSIVR